jgi:hypothetical protein
LFPAGNRWPRRVCLAAVLAVAALASGCGQLARSHSIPDEAPAHPRCGAPVRALGAPQLRRAYGLPAMLAVGINGTGTTIATIVSYASPGVARDLDVHSRRCGLPPTRVKIISYGRITHGAEGWPRASLPGCR